MTSIPISTIVQVNPDVVGTGGNPLALNLVLITKNDAVPAQNLLQFNSANAVSDYFGSSDTIAQMADIYFKGYDGATQLPSTLYVAHYADTNDNGRIFGGSLANVDLDTLKTYTGTLIVTIAGVANTSSSINLSTATSFSNAATIITAAFTSPDFAVTYDSQRQRFVVTSTSAGVSKTVIYATGTIATSLKLTQATGAILSQGIDAETPSDVLDRVLSISQNWSTFTTDYEPLLVEKKLYSAWSNNTNQRYLYICYDSDSNAIVANSSATMGRYLIDGKFDGTVCISGQPSVATDAGSSVVAMARDIAAFLAGTIASVDFSATNGRITFAFKHQSGLAINVNGEQIAANLIGNGYNFYAAYTEGSNDFNWFYNGNIAGRWVWLDSYVNQIYLNSQFRLAGATLLDSANAVDYGTVGQTQLRESLKPVIQEGLNSGIIRTGIALSSAQATQVNTQAGLRIDNFLQTDGYYLQIKQPSAQDRGLRKSPIINFWYTDGGAVQQIVLNSYNVL